MAYSQTAPDLLTALNRLSGGLRPAGGPRAADANVLPPQYDGAAYGMDSFVDPRGSACCTFGAMGCSCSCARKQGFNAWRCYGPRGANQYAMVDTDWPGIDWKNGVGPGPYIESEDVFPMQGRADLVPFGDPYSKPYGDPYGATIGAGYRRGGW